MPRGVELIEVAQRLASDLAEYAQPQTREQLSDVPQHLGPSDVLLAEYDRRVLDDDLRAATRSRFVSTHYADAVESGVKALNECVRVRSGSTEDGDSLMTAVFSPNAPRLRVNPGRSKSDDSEQRGHMHLCQGVVGAWRNPRAHSLMDDEPERALLMLEMIDGLMATTKASTKTRRPRKTKTTSKR
jgi:uncharacterized protein (TIGR02391 family)